MKTEQEIRDELAKIETVNDKQGWILGIELIRVNKAIIKILKWVLLKNVQSAPLYLPFISREMKRPILVLQYPDSRKARTVALAATRSEKALRAFKEAVLEDARLSVLDWQADEVIHLHEVAELERLQKLLDLLIPNGEEVENGY